MAGMDALDGLGQQGDDIAIAADIVMVRALAIFGLAAGDEVLDTEGAIALCRCTVNDEEFNGFQGLHDDQELENSRIIKTSGERKTERPWCRGQR